MKSLRRPPPAVWLAVVSLCLIVLPKGPTNSVRLSLLMGFEPLRSTSMTAMNLLEPVRGYAVSEEDYYEMKKKLEDEIARRRHMEVLRAKDREVIDVLRSTRTALPSRRYGLLNSEVVLTANASNWRRSVVVARGFRHGVTVGLPVVWNDTLIGRVADVGPWTCRVVLVTDPAFVAGAVTLPKVSVEGVPLSSREVGVARGATDHCLLKWLTSDRRVEKGSFVVTTSDPLHNTPEGLVIGQVTSVSTDRGPYSEVQVAPIVNVHALEFVVILIPKDEGE